MLKNKETIIAKYLSGNADPGEIQKVNEWIRSSAENESEFLKAKNIWEASSALKVDRDADVESAWAEFKSLAEVSHSETKPKIHYLRIAAGVALIALLSTITYFFLSDTTEDRPLVISMQSPQQSEDANPENVSVDTISTPDTLIIGTGKPENKKRLAKVQKNVVMITINTGDSAKAFLLPDNTVVFLNENSTLVYPENFNKTNRKVSLSGEAYFELGKDTMEFIVACKNTITRGRSASFNIKGYTSDKEVEVIIVSGNAEFSGVGKKEYKKLELKTGDRGTFSKDEKITRAKNTRKDFKWWQKKNLRAKIKRIIEKIKNRFN